MPNVTTSLPIQWKARQIMIRKGTPVDSSGNVVNDSTAYGIVTEDVYAPNAATVLTAGEFDTETNYCGFALSDDCKRALAAINFVDSEGKRMPVTTLPDPVLSDAGKRATVNEKGNAYETAEDAELPEATTEVPGIVKMAAAVPDSEEETSPTVEEFNALLAALRAAGIMSTPEPDPEDPPEPDPEDPTE